MLKITVPGKEYYDEREEQFVSYDNTELELEHSLVALSKWEEIYEKPYLTGKKMSSEEVMTYIKCMTLTEDYPEDVFSRLNQQNFDEIVAYIDKKMSATWFANPPAGPKNREVITTELIYHWMITYNIPFECKYWHLNRLFTLIKVSNVKNASKEKPKKLGQEDLARRREINEQRKAALNTSG